MTQESNLQITYWFHDKRTESYIDKKGSLVIVEFDDWIYKQTYTDLIDKNGNSPTHVFTVYYQDEDQLWHAGVSLETKPDSALHSPGRAFHSIEEAKAYCENAKDAKAFVYRSRKFKRKEGTAPEEAPKIHEGLTSEQLVELINLADKIVDSFPATHEIPGAVGWEVMRYRKSRRCNNAKV